MRADLIADQRCVLGESPLWHPGEQQLYWLDIERGRLLSYAPATGRHRAFDLGGVAGALALHEGGGLLVLRCHGAVDHFDGLRLSAVLGPCRALAGSRFNDALVTPDGDVLAGTMALTGSWAGRLRRRMPRLFGEDVRGGLHRLDRCGQLTTVLRHVSIPNGACVDATGRLYFTDSTRGEILRFERSPGGSLSGRFVFATVPSELGLPDGLTIDAEGCLWSARFGGGCVVRYAPDGREVDTIEVPARNVTSVAFGGPDLDTLYITSASAPTRSADDPLAGALFGCRPGVRGLPEVPATLRLRRQ